MKWQAILKMEEQNLEINGIIYKLKIYRERRRYSRASVSRNSINIRIPFFLIGSAKENEIDKLRKWAIGKIISNPSKFSRPEQIKYESGQHIYIAGREYALNIKEEDRTKIFAKISGSDIIIRIPQGSNHRIGKIISKLIAKEFLPFVEQRVKENDQIHFQKQLGRIVLKNNKSTWGSCSPRGDITIATRLMLAPVEVIDYVIVHELAHIVVRGHSKKFWKAVEKAMPDYRERRKWLRKNSDCCVL